jgi:hypothetical protein
VPFALLFRIVHHNFHHINDVLLAMQSDLLDLLLAVQSDPIDVLLAVQSDLFDVLLARQSDLLDDRHLLHREFCEENMRRCDHAGCDSPLQSRQFDGPVPLCGAAAAKETLVLLLRSVRIRNLL